MIRNQPFRGRHPLTYPENGHHLNPLALQLQYKLWFRQVAREQQLQAQLLLSVA